MTEQEEDLIFRMYKLVGDRWGLIAGRIPGRKAEEIERFWIMKHGDGFASRRRELKRCNSYCFISEMIIESLTAAVLFLKV
ncbi:hypothetical protein FNV43_RR18165 [Rhamnella rubrinervis]|uniref:Myb-like domain-containing protein n=1 Tax=Rhamnella rubrinervis TaxID=2594499 RepID=A0A8K0GSN3_9ROSA|nr:hypothetical protein FNV43_RR18165 [Rhamnella rubrinervis]